MYYPKCSKGRKPRQVSTLSDQQANRTEAAERRLAALAEEIDRVILECDPKDRDAMHGFAVSLVRDRLPPIDESEEGDSATEAWDDEELAEKETSGAANSIGLGLLLALVGLPLAIVFPLVGFGLIIAAAAMCGFGVLAFLFAKATGGAHKALETGGE